MLRLDKIIKPWRDAGSLNSNVNLYGFWDDTTFLTKSGDLGVVLKVCGVDFESLDQAGQEFAVKRLEAALKSFGPGFHVYQYLFKTNRPQMPFAHYGDPLIDAAIDQRRDFFEQKRDRLYDIEIFYAIVLEGARSKTGIGTAIGRFPSDPSGAIRELKAQFTGDNMKVLLRSQIQRTTLPNDAPAYDWKRETGDIQSYQHRDTGGWLHIDSQSQFFDRQAQPISREAALEATVHPVTPVIDQNGNTQSRTSTDIGIGI